MTSSYILDSYNEKYWSYKQKNKKKNHEFSYSNILIEVPQTKESMGKQYSSNLKKKYDFSLSHSEGLYHAIFWNKFLDPVLFKGFYRFLWSFILVHQNLLDVVHSQMKQVFKQGDWQETEVFLKTHCTVYSLMFIKVWMKITCKYII